MKELVVISGKGGTGKTSLTAAFASLAENFILCDADVDAPDLHLILKPEIKKREDFYGGISVFINQDKCTNCGTCAELCRFEAISETFVIDKFACEGCGVCVDNCPEKAIETEDSLCGEWYISETRFGPFVHAALGIAEENSGKLVSLIRAEAKKIAESKDLELIITDGTPGIGCPVIASITNSTAVLIVSEPTVSGYHDMIRVAELTAHFKIPSFLCVNKYDLNTEQTERIENEAEKRGIKSIGRIPFDKIFIEAMIDEKTIFEKAAKKESLTAISIKSVWEKIVLALSVDKNKILTLK